MREITTVAQPGVYALGIDEAGKGSWLGPMVLCGFYLRSEEEFRKLRSLPVNDSKLLSPKVRERLYASLKDFAHHCVLVTPEAIDTNNMNTLELEVVVDLAKNFKPRTLVFDAPVNPQGIPRLINRLRYLLTRSPGQSQELPRLIVENKADQNYLVCMAASIIAKVTRDREIEKLRQLYGDCGSGYPSDDRTLKFLESLNPRDFEAFSPNIRKKWSSMKRLQTNNSQRQKELIHG